MASVLLIEHGRCARRQLGSLDPWPAARLWDRGRDRGQVGTDGGDDSCALGASAPRAVPGRCAHAGRR